MDSIPSGLKNAIEWCVSTTVFSKKITALITASASGLKAHEELQLIMKTVECNFTKETTLLIPGVKGKVDKVTDQQTKSELRALLNAFCRLIENN